MNPVLQYVIALLQKVANYVSNHPAWTAAVAVAFVPGLVVTPALGVLGFSAAGPVAGSIAAGWQAMYGGMVPAGGLFAILQSAAMGGTAIVGWVTTATAAAGVSVAQLNTQDPVENEAGSDDEGPVETDAGSDDDSE